jgi:hypothetical protein
MAELIPLTEQEVVDTIRAFWRMQADRARLVELMTVTDEDLEIRMGDVAFRGYAGLEDHQYGSKSLYFDQEYDERRMSVSITSDGAVVESEMQWSARHWEAPAARSAQIKAVYEHTWRLRRSPSTGKPVIFLNQVERMHYVDGFAPPSSSGQVDIHVGKEV